jgi:hypothetical protein
MTQPMVATTTGGAALPGYPMTAQPLLKEQPKKGGGATLAIAIAAVVAIGGGAAGFFLLRDKKQASEDDSALIDVDKEDDAEDEDADDKDEDDQDADKDVSPLAKLKGRWKSESGREVDAQLVGESLLEFRVVDPVQFAPADYQAGEPRITLKSLPNQPTTFAVEDRLRPTPPVGKRYDAIRARTTCIETFTETGGAPLQAALDGEQLRIDFVKIEPKLENFVIDGGSVVSCVGLRSLPTSKLTVTFKRL